MFVGIAPIVGYAFLGATLLILKTEGRIQQRFYGGVRTLDAAGALRRSFLAP